jgi:hypothetical protein
VPFGGREWTRIEAGSADAGTASWRVSGQATSGLGICLIVIGIVSMARVRDIIESAADICS